MNHTILPRLTPDQLKFFNSLLLDDEGRIKVVPSYIYETVNPDQLSVWSMMNGFYGLPTIELIEWLKEEIKGLNAIEIGAGQGAIGSSLGIIQTDSRLQERPDIQLNYKLLGQRPIQYPDSVEKLDALRAVRKYKPDCVIGCWITQREKDANNFGKGNYWGINEMLLLKKVKKYILIANEVQHDQKEQKKILNLPHKTYKFPWIKSRTTQGRGHDVIYVWER